MLRARPETPPGASWWRRSSRQRPRLALEDEVDGLALRPDMSVTVEVLLGEKDRALVLPTWLVRDAASAGPFVLVVEEGQATQRAISLGLRGDEAVEVTSGLAADEPVLPPDADVGPGEPVRIRPPQPALPGG